MAATAAMMGIAEHVLVAAVEVVATPPYSAGWEDPAETRAPAPMAEEVEAGAVANETNGLSSTRSNPGR
jgi:hypothetical protein